MKKQIKVYRKKSFYMVSLVIVIICIWSEVWNYRSASLDKNTSGMVFFPSSYEGSSFVDLPVGEAVESKLQADFTMNGFYPFSQNRDIKVFTSASYENGGIGMHLEIFKHSPDNCWVLSGWSRIEDEDETLKISDITFHRRVYVFEGLKELCYFAYLIDGKILSSSQMTKLNCISFYEKEKSIRTGLNYFWMRTKETLSAFFHRSWSRSNHVAQFIRISTTIDESSIEHDNKLNLFISGLIN